MTASAGGSLIAVVLAAGLVLGGCVNAPVGSSAPPTTAPPGGPPSGAEPAPRVDVAAADTEFAAMMTPHHAQALELSALVDGRSASPEVDDLAFRIDRDQVEEIGQMRGFLNLRGVAPSTGHDMAGMADAATLQRLRTSSGPAFDRLWLQTMTAHHRGALTMARDYLTTTGGRGSLADFARSVLVTQQAEIDRMTAAYR